MERLNEITAADVERLSASDLTVLLKKLLVCEANAYNLPPSGVHVAFKITVPDGGEDGRIEWKDGPERTAWVPNRFTIFQCKATEITASACKKEVLNDEGTNLKPKVEAVFEAGGAYILFYGRPCELTGCEARREKIRDALRDLGKSYAETAQIEVYSAEKIAEWSNQYVSCVTFVAERSGILPPLGIKTWDQWSKLPEHEGPYVANELLRGCIAQLSEVVAEPGAVARVEGMSGLGKTRLVLEAFRPDEAGESVRRWSDRLVYLDASIHEREVHVFCVDLCNRQLEGIVIVDNCPLALHKTLSSEVQRSDSKLRLITLDYAQENHDPEILTIRLKRENLEDVVRQLLVNALPELEERDRQRIEELVQGFPQMAVLIARAKTRGDPNIGALNDDEILKKLVWGREPVEEKGELVIEACSIFMHVGIAGRVENQLNFVATKICESTPNDFYRWIQTFISRGICQQAGDFIYVAPKPLAIQLAARWWTKRLPSSVPQLLNDLVPVGLDAALCDQMSYLDFLPKAQGLTADLCGHEGPFGRAEVLTSEQGSRLFRSLVEVSPSATAEAVARVFSAFDRTQLLQIKGRVRRNLVWAIEKLCFWQETFELAAAILLRFAAAEVESWANNATGQFGQLYHIILPGTQASLRSRLIVAEDALKYGDPYMQRVAVEALGCALESGFFSRTSGVETQGSRAPLKDYQPEPVEIAEYWKRAGELLVNQVEKGGKIGELALQQLAKHIRGLLANNQLPLVENVVTRVVAMGTSWPDGASAIRESLKYDGKKLPEKIRERLQKLLTLLEPKDIPGKLRSIVSTPDWDMEEISPGHYEDVAEREAKRFADEISASGDAWLAHLEIVFTGEQRQGFAFGHRLSEIGTDRRRFISACLETLRGIAPEKRRISVLAGFLAGQPDRAIIMQTLDAVSKDERIAELLVDLTRVCRPTRNDLRLVLNQFANGKTSVAKLMLFGFGSVLNHLEPPDIISFAKAIAVSGPAGAATALFIVYMYCSQNNERVQVCKDVMLDFASTEGLLAEVARVDAIGHPWQQVVTFLLREDPPNPPLARRISTEIVRYCQSGEIDENMRHFAQPVLELLLDRYLEDSWQIVGTALLSGDFLVVHRLKRMLGGPFNKESRGSLISGLQLDFLRKWGYEHGPAAASLFATICPAIFVGDDKSATWHPIAKMLLDEFGDQERVLKNLSSNLATFSASGSLIPHYEQRIQLMKQISEHPNLKVREWSRQEIRWLLDQIKRERKAEEEQAIGIFRRE